MSRFYDRQGQPIEDVLAWGRLQENDDYKRVAVHTFGDVMVSTVWLGIDHNFWSPGDPPIIFETMVFGGPLDQEQDRYSTEEQALAGHDQMVAKVRAQIAHNDGADHAD